MYTAQKEEEAEKRRIEQEEEEERKRKEKEIERAAAAATREALAKKDLPASSSSTRKRTEYESLSKKVSKHEYCVTEQATHGARPGTRLKGLAFVHVQLLHGFRCAR